MTAHCDGARVPRRSAASVRLPADSRRSNPRTWQPALGRLALFLLTLPAVADTACAQPRRRRRARLKILDTKTRLGDSVDLGNREGWQAAEPGAGPEHRFQGDVVVESQKLIAGLCSQSGQVVLLSKAPNVKRSERMRLRLVSAKGKTCSTLRAVRIEKSTGQEATLLLTAATAEGEEVKAALRLGAFTEFVEVRPVANAGALRVAQRSRFLAIPEPFGDDTVYDAWAFPGASIRIPSEGLLAAFPDGAESIALMTWPTNRDKRIDAFLEGRGAERRFAGLSISFDGKSVFTAFVDHPGIWHARAVDDPTWLDKDIATEWQRPFEAVWRADFCGQDGTDSWKPQPKRVHRWSSRFARRITYPFWFDGDRAVVRLIGKDYLGWVLIYPFDRSDRTPLEVRTFDDIMRDTVGMGICEYVLDKEKDKSKLSRRYLKGGVCDSTGALQHFFLRGIETKQPEVVGTLVDDAVDLITTSRERVEEYRTFSARVGELCRTVEGKSSGLKALSDKLQRWAGEIDKVCRDQRERMQSPEAAAEIGREIKGLTKEKDPENLGRCMVLGRELRTIQSSHEVILARVRKAVSRIRQLAALAAADDPEATTLGAQVREMERKTIGRD